MLYDWLVLKEEGGTIIPIILSRKAEKVMQFIGLLDKNGKEIYAGDIVKIRGLKIPQIVGFDAGWACYCFIYDTGEIMRKITPREITKMEVIGNIYSNPELIKII